MIIRTATSDEQASWNDHIAANPDGGNVFQSSSLAETKRLGGWRPHYLFADTLALTVLEKRIPFLGRYWYLPKGPGIQTVDDLLSVAASLKGYALTQGVFAIKLEPEIIESDQAQQALKKAGLIPTHAVQPNVSTVVLDLTPALDEVMATFNQKGRYAIHRAERDGVTTETVAVTDDNMRLMYRLLSDTAAGRFESSLRSYAYYREFWTRFSADGRGSLFFARVDGEVVSAAFCMYLGKKGLYKDGASVRVRTTYGASHLLQWQVITWMKAHGVTSYDLCGAPHSSRVHDESGPYYGIGLFKTSFNKHITDYVGCFDVVVKPRKYRAWQLLGERICVSLSYRLRHDQWF